MEVDSLTRSVYEHLARGDADHALRLAKAGVNGARTQADRAAEATAQDLLATSLAACGSWAEAASVAREAIAIFLELGDRSKAVRSLQTLAEVGSQEGKGAEMLKEIQAFRDECRAVGDVAAEGMASQAACVALYSEMRLDECLAAAREAQGCFERAGNTVGQALSLLMMAEVRLAAGTGHDFARRAAQRARRLLREAGSGHEAEVLRAHLAECQALVRVLAERPVHVRTASSWADALKMAQQTEEIARSHGDVSSAASALSLAAQVHMANERFQAALRTANAAVDIFRGQGDTSAMLRVLFLGADAALRTGRRKEARRLATEALELAAGTSDAVSEEQARKILEGVGQELPETAAGDGQLSGQQQKDAPVFGWHLEPPEAPRNLAEMIQQVLTVDVTMGPFGDTPLMQPGVTGPLPLMSRDHILATGRQQQQGLVALSLMQRHSEATARCRADRLISEETATPSKGGAPAEGSSAAWVAPVRKRMESGVLWRPPTSKPTGVSFESLQRRSGRGGGRLLT